MKLRSGELDDRLSLEEVLTSRSVPPRDCRECPKFAGDPQGRGFGFCQAHQSYVKLYHAEELWHSQCQFKVIRQVRALPLAVGAPAPAASAAG